MCLGCSPAQGPHLIVWLVVLGYGGPLCPVGSKLLPSGPGGLALALTHLTEPPSKPYRLGALC